MQINEKVKLYRSVMATCVVVRKNNVLCMIADSLMPDMMYKLILAFYLPPFHGTEFRF